MTGEARPGRSPFEWPSPEILASCLPRRRAQPAGVVVDVVVREAPGPCVTVTLEDGTGRLGLEFLGRRAVPGIVVGARLQVEGIVRDAGGGLVMMNPRYRFLP